MSPVAKNQQFLLYVTMFFLKSELIQGRGHTAAHQLRCRENGRWSLVNM